MNELDFIVPGDIASRTGGYLYDRQMIDGLRARPDWQVRLHALEASFPQPTAAALQQARAVLADLPAGTTVVFDGLALAPLVDELPLLPVDVVPVALIHHPLADETGLSGAQQAQFRQQERQALAQMRRVIVTSPATARTLVAEYGVPAARVDVVLPGVEPPLIRGEREGFTMMPSAENPTPALPLSGEGVCCLLCVATLIPRKGHRYLIEALSHLQDRPWQLICVGGERDPATAAVLRAQIAAAGLTERVHLAGEADAAALAAWYAQADIFVLPSLHEGYGMVLAEALAHGLPIVSTTAGAIPDTVPAAAGLLVAPADSTALTAALARLLDDPTEQARLAAAAAAAGQQLPDWVAAVDGFAAALQRARASGDGRI